jgi:phage/plasmid-like protein (TIGR03299 family)
MAHAITIREDGYAEMAYRGDVPWHGLGNPILPDDSVDDIVKKAGMEWDIRPQPHMFVKSNGSFGVAPNSIDLIRADTEMYLASVSDKYHVVQPRDVVEFFAETVKSKDMRIITAGTLHEGRRFWAMAEPTDPSEATTKIGGRDVDKIVNNVLITSSVMGEATRVIPTSIRVVCQNTLSMATSDSASGIRQTHRTPLDVESLQRELGIHTTQWKAFKENAERLLQFAISQETAKEILAETLRQSMTTEAVKKIAKDSKSFDKGVEELMHLYYKGQGASPGTAWGVLNAVTERFTHGSALQKRGRVASSTTKFWSSTAGADAKTKVFAMNMLLDLAA